MKLRALVLLGAVSAMIGVAPMARPAVAVAPSNDDVANATEITQLPFSDTVDTTDATTNGDELTLAQYCGSPVVEHAVWYKATIGDSAGGSVRFATEGFATRVLVLVGEPGALSPVACTYQSVSGTLPGGPGTEVYIMVFGDGRDGGTPYGDLQVTVSVPPAPPELSVSVAPVAYVDRAGGATLSGTLTCTDPNVGSTVQFFNGQMRQTVGRFSLSAYIDMYPGMPCDGSTTTWSTYVTSDNGKFAGGKAQVTLFVVACNVDQICSGAQVDATIQLTKGRIR